ncbi:tetraacyldisaccharide 4'-kinase [Corticibacter populi]|uniref:Tetraacyldisaccharide 4'-kinase n=1 Tax=Corticibacter populi TaxID=1550736 RepID=A0A3M6QIP2_9BURK|nr:tetraacyldisaccharide 4'-kinase [Corticibacter populi]RMX02591.1 tetraacyldisaccharide 4'-kinase [Corticibacter populi]RZS32996.1 lipid-A-disaccharide kinase [Corticibacter populi]
MSFSLQQAWRRRSGLAALLWPLSVLYGTLAGLRRALYRLGLRQSRHLPVPTVVVGNVIAGGAGKTPVTIALVQALQHAGIAAGVIARGYGRQSRDCRAVTATSSAGEVGDEPLLIHRATGAPVFVAARRHDAGMALLQAHPEVRIIVCDDGLQHLALERDFEICVFPANGIGNGWLLPAGPLREPWPRKVDAVLQAPGIAPALPLPAATPSWTLQRRLADAAHNAQGQTIPLAQLAALQAEAGAAPLAAVAGIARPESFFEMLQARGLHLHTRIALPDHFDYAAPPAATPTLQAWQALQVLPVGTPLLCTEKDAVKLWSLRPDAWAVPLEVTLPQPLVNAVLALLDTNDAASLRSSSMQSP